ncbi:MAG: outer membrane protein assembly factor BamB family protein, partial [Chitinophagaceae bacterium]
MRITLLLIIAVFYFLNCFSQVNDAAMFRDNAVHNSYVATKNDLIYDTKAWHFFAGAPVRSTPLVSSGVIFFGNTKGDFFAVDKRKGYIKWQFNTGMAINSSAACQGDKLFFTDNGQILYCITKSSGKKLWQFKMGEKIAYPWRFDYYYSSPVLYEDKLIVGSDDGYLYNFHQRDGKLAWKFKSKGLIRGTAAIYKEMVLFGDTDGIFYALDLKTGKEKWIFKVKGHSMNPEEFGFDRKAILAAPVISKNKIIFGARDGFLYCLDAGDGRQVWVADHQVSWVISTVAIKDSFVVTGTSDGRFVQALNLDSGKEVWKFRPNSLFWSSPLIVNDKVYAGSFDGILYCLDLKTGQRVSQYSTGEKILSSPVWDDELLYFGSDDGHLYALKGHLDHRFAKTDLKRFVYHEPGAKAYFRNGSDLRIKNYLINCGFKSLR